MNPGRYFFCAVGFLILFAPARSVFCESVPSSDSVETQPAETQSVAANDENALPQPDTVFIKMKNGNALTCTLQREDARSVTILWQGSEITLQRNEIAEMRLQAGPAAGDGLVLKQAKEWNYRNNPVVKMTNGQIIDAKIVRVAPDGSLTTQKDLGGGDFAEIDIPKDKIEAFEFRPVRNELSSKIEETLRKQFTKMVFYEIGMVTLVTDTQGSSLRLVRQAIQDQQRVFYTDFFSLAKTRQPECQSFVVLFDKLNDYFGYALADHVPAWYCPGYFNPEQKALFLSNNFGDEGTDLIYEALGKTRDQIDSAGQQAVNRYGKEHEIAIDGITREIKVTIENAVAYIRGIAMEQTLVTLRHELMHELFHNWKIQNMIVSRIEDEKDELLTKKKELLDAKTVEEKKKLVMEILCLKNDNATGHVYKAEASNSWFVEGLAEYGSTSAIGERNDERLYVLKEARKKNDIWPLSQLTVFKMGSFPGVQVKAALSAYAQSWNFVEFLMAKHREGFMAYLDRMTRETPTRDEDLKWLLEAVGLDLKSLEKEWHEYIDTKESVEDPHLERFLRVEEMLYPPKYRRNPEVIS